MDHFAVDHHAGDDGPTGQKMQACWKFIQNWPVALMWYAQAAINNIAYSKQGTWHKVAHPAGLVKLHLAAFAQAVLKQFVLA